MFNKLLFRVTILLGSLSGVSVFGQKCDFTISGTIKDLSINEPISKASIFIEELKSTTTSDASGSFLFSNLCEGDYHVLVTHVGCEPQNYYLHISRDTTLSVVLNHFSHAFDDVLVKGDKNLNSSSNSAQTLSSQSISENADKNFGGILESVAGVGVIKNGSGVAKPVVQGMYGNRLTIVNNGVSQGGQQWGNDHSPEIDPLLSQEITVVKGVSAIEYQGSNLGNFIIVDNGNINKDEHWHGNLQHIYETNGRGNGIHFQTEKWKDNTGYKIGGTLKKVGDRKAPNYYLTNTGVEEAHFALQLETEVDEYTQLHFFASSFNSEIGILRGSHISNLTDLQFALGRNEPFFTNSESSFEINAPRQLVNHHLAKATLNRVLKKNQKLSILAASQLNIRKEFDVRRGNRTTIPALSLNQWTHYLEAKYNKFFRNNSDFNAGVQYTFINNQNVPETGILPLIPDYASSEVGLFATLFKSWHAWEWNVGGRFDFEYQNVADISQDLPRRIIRYNNYFPTGQLGTGLSYKSPNNLKYSFNLGYASRNPAINELYSFGLHQGVSGIEVGDPSLQAEHSVKLTATMKGNVRSRFFFEPHVFYQRVQDYIYLQPQQEFRLTIRGAFPVFAYQQANAELYGFDINTSFLINDIVDIHWKYSFIEGNNLEENVPIVYLPSNNWVGEVHFELPNLLNLNSFKMVFANRFVARQNDILPGQDFFEVPEAYNLVNASISAEKQWGTRSLTVGIKVDNVFNTVYRDYLDRLRYFSDSMGRNIIVNTNFKF